MTSFPDPERWRALDALFAGALDRAPAERDSYLREATGDDPHLFREACALLERAAEAERALGESAAEHAGALLSSLDSGLAAGEALSVGWDGLAAGTEAAIEGGARPEAVTARGESIGPYRVEEEIGRGGMGIVYRAVDGRLGRRVALKFLPPSSRRDEAAKRRLLEEARAVSATEHPNVGTLYEIGEAEDGRSYLVLACYEGETLKERIARGPLPPAEALEVARQIAAGLAAAHAKGIVHRDIKPGNVFLTADGWVKILDFGVAKLAAEGRARGDRIGTVGYMSPEQVRGERVDARSDLWSLGVVLHEMLAGARPFRGSRPEAVMRAILEDEPAGLERVPARLRPLLVRALARDPTERYGSAAELARDLERSLASTPNLEGSRRDGRPPRRRAVALALGLLAVAAVAVWAAFPELRPGGTGFAASGIDAGAPAGVGAGVADAAATHPDPELAALLDQATDFLRRYRREDNEVAMGLLARAIEADPSFALAHARLGTARALKVFQYGDGYEWADSALASAGRAVALDAELAEGHQSLGMANLAWERYDEALEAFGRALALDPEYWAAANLTGIVRWRRGDYDEALRWYRRALELEPTGTANVASTLSTIGGAYAFLGLFGAAEAVIERALVLQPDLPLGHLNAVLLALVRGRDAEAVEHGRALITISPGNARAWATAGTAHQFAGDRTAARFHFERAYDLSPTGFDLLWRSVPVLLAHELRDGTAEDRARAAALLAEYEAFARELLEAGNEGSFLRSNLAAARALRGDPEGAFRLLKESVSHGRREHGLLSRDPLFQEVRADPRFGRILAANRAEMERQRARVEREGW